MTDKKKPKAIILDQNSDIQEHAQSILIQEGWDVFCEQVSRDALDTLTQAKRSPFALFISNYKLPKMDGDDILQEVKAISPLTQRMLLIPADELKTLIRAIQKAKINACITSPFKDNDLIVQSRTCFKQFIRARKKQHFKREMLDKNRQMLQIAQNFKKKAGQYTKIIKKKKQEVLKLKSAKRELKNKLERKIDLESMLELKEIKPSREVFQNEFIALCKTIKNIFDELTNNHDSKLIKLDFSTILDHEQNEVQNSDSDLSEHIKQIIRTCLTHANATHDTSNESADLPASDKSEEPFEISFSENHVKAYLKKNSTADSDATQATLADILELLKENHISYGIIEDITIESWIETSFIDKILIATGEEPVQGSHGKIKYNFKTEYTNPGKINEDGSIDFKERGEIPFVNKGDVLAVKTAAKEGKPGINVSGNPIHIDESIDPVFTAGPGTQISEDELTIHAALDGQPNLDAMGTITVNPELAIPGDVDFETGNIDFNGNIIVNGMVKEGFTIKGVNLIAKEIEGAFIELSGDLNVSAGITDSNISTQGNIYAKFINHSQIMAFGNLEVSKEIIDSDILLSGSCQNQSGHILTSKISAKMGIEAGKIGTSSAKPSKLDVGVDKHIETLTGKIEESLKASVGKSDLLKDDINSLEDEDQELYKQVSEKAHIQDRAQLEIKELKNSGKADTSMEILKLEKQAKQAELELNEIFETQDRIATDIDLLKKQLNAVEAKNKTFMLEKKALLEFSKKNESQPVITIAQTIAQDTMIKGPHSNMILKENASRCKIQELAGDHDGIAFYEMTISDP